MHNCTQLYMPHDLKMQEAKHIRFIDSDDEDSHMREVVNPSTEPAQLQSNTEAPPSVPLNIVSSITTDYDTNDKCYVLQLVHIPTSALVAATLSNRRIKLFSIR